ncbi:MAG TPA: LamG domain-containing protein [Gemmataceae bacterium]|nr:LamG domain-containing protein [Gemmataceae bacterium]
MRRLAAFLLLLTLAGRTAAQQGPTHQWQFEADHVRGNIVKPLAGALDASIAGPIRFSADKPRALLLDGNSKARHAVNVTADLARAGLPAKDITAEAWVRVDKTHQWGGIIGAFQHNGPYQKGWLLGFNHGQFSFAVAARNSKKLTYLKAPTTFQTGFWYHVVGTYDGKEQRIYVDGKLQAVARAQNGSIDYPPRAFFSIGSIATTMSTGPSLASSNGSVSSTAP